MPQIRDNTAIRSLSSVPGFFASGVWETTSIKIKDQFLYRPLFMTYLSIGYRLWGLNPAGFHAVSLCLHLLNTLLVFLLIRSVVAPDDPVPPLIGAAFFGLHPVHAESVSWISAVPDLMATALCLASLLLYRRRESDWYRMPAAIVLFVCAVLTKEAAIVLPAIILVYDILIDRRANLPGMALYAAAAAAYFIVRTLVLGKTAGTLAFSAAGVANMVTLTALYIKSFILPWPPGIKFTMPAAGLPLTIVMLLTGAVVVWYAVPRRRLLFGLLWIIVCLMPPLSLAFHTRPTFGERFLYLPSAGFAILAAGVFAEFGMRRRRMAVAMSGCLALIWGGLTVASIPVWGNDGAFYATAIRNSPRYFGAHEGLALYYEGKGMTGVAVDTYLAAATVVGEEDRPRAYGNIALLYGQAGDVQKSIEFFSRQLVLSPGSSSAMVGLGNNYWTLRDYPKAVSYYERALSADPANYEACYNLGLLYGIMGERGRAEDYLQRFVQSAPADKYAETIRSALEKIELYSAAKKLR